MNHIDFTAIPASARPADPQVWQVLSEQAASGEALFLTDGSIYAVNFFDEPEPIPFEHLAYSRDIGLYDKRRFPTL